MRKMKVYLLKTAELNARIELLQMKISWEIAEQIRKARKKLKR